MARERLTVNVLDPKDIEAKMPEISRALEQAKEELAVIRKRVEVLTRLAGTKAETSAGATTAATVRRGSGRPQKAAPSQERAIAALSKAGRPMGPSSLFHFMEAEGMERPASVAAMNSILWAAAKAGRVSKTPNGLYVPPGFPADRPLTDYDEAARKGFPTPAHLGGNGAAAQASPNGSPPAGEDREQGFEGSRSGSG